MCSDLPKVTWLARRRARREQESPDCPQSEEEPVQGSSSTATTVRLTKVCNHSCLTWLW